MVLGNRLVFVVLIVTDIIIDSLHFSHKNLTVCLSSLKNLKKSYRKLQGSQKIAVIAIFSRVQGKNRSIHPFHRDGLC